ncbi:cytochrome c oxidase, cbb3-type, CcoQ subunit [Helicobacter kayseriensis]|uniref:cytochrome c oxidase, cbb3-type, CcoQ subunit n=1 Tax=Helicobacter kayseriensis TaxID=2905877 RepID=UPI001E377FD6|nr:cytochrome c oxidase, cbb3-type, CcoQ subunit [Helicobacter kayseriensis]MCE3047063.1 cytochrome c oxidase, cbb3-type, CcoQ subunit [Helicobacter kayseriensis]MCE3048277.1 cytochrome c oxidase, cbb3-type, CcoQ subunit [Helicobacter kayseriensis]
MEIETLTLIQKNAYLIITIILCLCLYGYILSMYRSEARGERDYEKYSRLALDDSMNDEVIEKR